MAWPVHGGSGDAGSEDQKEADLNCAVGNRIALKRETSLCPFSGTKGWWVWGECSPFALLSISLEVLTPSSFNYFNTSDGFQTPY